MARTLSEAAIQNVRQNCEDYPEAETLRGQLVSAPDDRLVNATDDWLIDFVPDPDVKRALLVHEELIPYGCPIHRGGRYVFTDTADPFVPYELTCPTGGEVYPNDEFPEAGPPTSPWEKQGWLDAREPASGSDNPTLGLRYHFNAHYAYWGRWMKLGPFMHQLAVSHLLADDGDPQKHRTAHAASVLLLRLTAVFPMLRREDFRSAAGVRDFPFTVKIMDYVWEPGHTDQYALTFDYIRDALIRDESLLALDYRRIGRAWGDDPDHDLDGDGEVTTADLVAWVERDLLRAYADLYTEIAPVYANATIVHQKTLSVLAAVLNDGRYYEHARSVLVDHIATNWYTNDGAYYEGAIPGYGRFGQRALRDATFWLRRFDPNLVVPRVVKGYLFGPSMVCVERTLPNNDDSGGVRLERLDGDPGFSIPEYERSFLDYRDPRLLQAVSRWKRTSGEPGFEQLEDLTERRAPAESRAIEDARKAAPAGSRRSTVTRAGYAVLRGGTGERPFDLFITFDGQAGSHTHYDTFNPILYGFGYELIPELGYPPKLRGASRYDWINHSLSHWMVTVDRRSVNPDFERAQLKLFVDRPGLRVFSGAAPTSYGPTVRNYERTLIVIDKPDGTPIVVDVFRVSGGREHLYSFHGAAPDGTEGVIAVGGRPEDAAEWETLQGLWHGKQIAYGQPPEDSDDRCLAYLVDPRIVAPSETARALHVCFPRQDGEATQLDFWMPTTCADAFVIAEGRREPVAGKGSAKLPYLIARSGNYDDGVEADSLFCAVVEPHQGSGSIESVTYDREEEILTIRLRGGEKSCVRAGLEAVSITNTDADGSPGRDLSAELPELGRIQSVAYPQRTIDLAATASVREGELLIVENDLGRNTFYSVDRVERGRVTLGDQWTDLCVARGYLNGRAEGQRLGYDADYIIQDPIRAQCRGARICFESGDSCRIVRVDKEWIYLDAEDQGSAKVVERAGHGGRQAFQVYDFGPGDVVKRIEVSDSLAH